MLNDLSLQLISFVSKLTGRVNFGASSLTTLEFITILFAEILLFAGMVSLIMRVGTFTKQSNELNLINSTRLILYQVATFLFFSIYILMGSQKLNSVDWAIGVSLFDNTYQLNFWTQVVKLFVVLISLFLLSLNNFAPNSNNLFKVELPILIVIVILLNFVLISTTSFIVLLLALEGFSLSLYIMAAMSQTHGGVTAAVKYFSYGTLGSIFLFWGTVHLYAIIPNVSFSVIKFLTDHTTLSNQFSSSLEFATTAITLGFLIKLGAAPTHQWVADVYTGSQMVITAIFATLVKFIFFILFIRTVFFLMPSLLIDFAALVSLIFGCYLTLKQTEIKRFLAYSSIVHVAFLLMGDISASLLYVLTYVMSSLVFFSVLSTIRINGKEIVYLNDLRYLRQTSYWNVGLLVFALASAAGLPPFAGFYGKFAVWVSLIEDIYLFNNIYTYVLLLMSIAVSLITIFYYMRVIAYMFISDDMQTSSELHQLNTLQQVYNSYKKVSMPQAFIAFLLVFWALVQPYFLTSFNLLSYSLTSF